MLDSPGLSWVDLFSDQRSERRHSGITTSVSPPHLTIYQ